MIIKTRPQDLSPTDSTKSSRIGSLTQNIESNQGFKNVGTLRRRLLITLLPTVLVPLAIAGFIGETMTERRARNEIIHELETKNAIASKTIAYFVRDSFQTIDLIAANPEVRKAMKASTEIVRERQLTQQPLEEVEQEFAQNKRLNSDRELNNFLEQIVRSTPAAEVFFTESNGFNVAYSNPTSDLVQSDEEWWQNAAKNGRYIQESAFDDSAKTTVLGLSQKVTDPFTGEFLGIVKSNVSIASLNADLNNLYAEKEHVGHEHQEQDREFQFQIIDTGNGFLVSNIDLSEHDHNHDSADRVTETEETEIIGGEPVIQAAKTLVAVANNSLGIEGAEEFFAQQSNFSEVNFNTGQDRTFSQTVAKGFFKYQDKIYILSTIPQTNLVSVGLVDYETVNSAGRNIQTLFLLTTIILGIFSLLIIILLSRQITKPLSNLSRKTRKVTEGNLDLKANLEGTLETQTLANNFNQLVDRIKFLLKEQTALAEQQRQEKEQLEKAIYTLLEEVSDATEGDLTVRASLDSLEISTVADLFNAIVTSLQDIAVATKDSAHKVSSSLQENEAAIRLLAQQATDEARETRETLVSMKQMNHSIQNIAQSASQVEKIADDTYDTVRQSTQDMDSTVDSILKLRTTVDDTAKKMKRLAESSQKVSRAVSAIEEIALKTNVLAANATIEASRAGEYGRGFSVVAEQVGVLAEQSATAAREIGHIVATIQAATTEVSQAMESSISQVVGSTQLVESTKQSLNLILAKSQTINRLMGSVSQSTESQAKTSQKVATLMQTITQASETTSESSKKVAQSIYQTAQVAKNLESNVAQFKVAE